MDVDGRDIGEEMELVVAKKNLKKGVLIVREATVSNLLKNEKFQTVRQSLYV